MFSWFPTQLFSLALSSHFGVILFCMHKEQEGLEASLLWELIAPSYLYSA